MNGWGIFRPVDMPSSLPLILFYPADSRIYSTLLYFRYRGTDICECTLVGEERAGGVFRGERRCGEDEREWREYGESLYCRRTLRCFVASACFGSLRGISVEIR